MITSSMKRRAQALVRACYYWSEYAACLPDSEDAYYFRTVPFGTAGFPTPTDADGISLGRCVKAFRRVGSIAEVISAIRSDRDVRAAAQRTLSLLLPDTAAVDQCLMLHDFRNHESYPLETDALNSALETEQVEKMIQASRRGVRN